ncbi:MAG: Unknown protein [uncultured Sulfurovum sp.]|uniref:Uncharacterized protein n=1 Tax=uncultured Sulfurovum sp. TaxID=269237 RepID=A0A6S6SYC1_9BACT|nr:MAG: Unknown protein [uncultured Sulfurovum sp.]
MFYKKVGKLKIIIVRTSTTMEVCAEEFDIPSSFLNANAMDIPIKIPKNDAFIIKP